MQFLILLEYDKRSRKNSRLEEALDSKIGKAYTVNRDDEKVIIKEALFDVLQAEIESSDIDFISLISQDDDGKTSFVFKDAEMWTEEYDSILRHLRFVRKAS